MQRRQQVHIAVDTLGHLLALYVNPANEQDRAQEQESAQQVQQLTAESVEVAFVDQVYSGSNSLLMLLPRCWLVERSFVKDGSLPSSSTRL